MASEEDAFAVALEGLNALLVEVMGLATAELLWQRSRELAAGALRQPEDGHVSQPSAEAHLRSLLGVVRSLTGEVLDRDVAGLFERVGIEMSLEDPQRG